jgi:hypothetical protein
MMEINTFALIIKRIPLNVRVDYIKSTFLEKGIGEVNEVTLTKRKNDLGQEYNSAVVTFNFAICGKNCQSLISQMNSSPDGTTRFYYSPPTSKYWIIKIHNVIETKCYDMEDIKVSDSVMHSLAMQLFLSEQKNKILEKKIEELTKKSTFNDMKVVTLNVELETKDAEISELNSCLKNIQEENALEKSIMSNRLCIYKDTIEKLNESINDERSILEMVKTDIRYVSGLIENSSDVVLKNQIVNLIEY